jgi:hypothetical protein
MPEVKGRGAPRPCAVRVQAKLDGVTASVILLTERACISASATAFARDLVDVVEAVGYTAGVSI